MTNCYVFDLEADNLLETATRVWCGAFQSVDGKDKRFFDLFCIKEMLEFMSTCDTLIAHNGTGYDFPLLEKLYDYQYKGERFDTMVVSKLYKPNRFVPPNCPVRNKPHALVTWGYRTGLGKLEHEDWSQYSEDMKQRCIRDVEITLRTYNMLLEEKAEYNWGNATWLSNRLFSIIGKQEAYGWYIDQPWAWKCLNTLDRWTLWIDEVLANRLPMMAVCEEKLVKGELGRVRKPFKKDGCYTAQMEAWFLNTSHTTYEAIDRLYDREVGNTFSRVTFRRVDPNKRVEAIDYLLAVGWIPKEWNINKETGERSSPKLSHKDDFEGVQGKEGGLFARRMQVKHRRSNIAGYLSRVRGDGRIPSRVTGLAETGRLKHADIVNVPNGEAFFGKWMRKIFSHQEGKVLIGTDADSCQNRMLAARVNNPEFTEALLNGSKEDRTTIHYRNQSALMDEGYVVPYGNCKNLQYGFLFGASDNKLGSMVGGNKDDGTKVRVALLKASPGLEGVIESLKDEWRGHAKVRKNPWGKAEYYNGWITGLDNRPVFIDSEHKLLVYALQSDEAIVMETAYVFLYDWLISEGYKWGIDWAYINFNHDEYQIECEPKHVERIKFLAEQAIHEAGKYHKLSVPQIGEAQVGRNWFETH